MCKYQNAWLYFLHHEHSLVKDHLLKINNETIFKEMALIFYAEILDYINNNTDEAIDIYLKVLELYPNSIYYDDIRLRIRELAS